MCGSSFILALVAILVPPLPVCIKRGCCGPDMLINVALCFLGFIPGLIHSWYIISITPGFHEYERIVDVEAGTVRRRNGRHGDGYYVDRQRRGNPRATAAPSASPEGGVRVAAPRANNGVPALRPAEQQVYGVNGVNGEGSSNDVPPPPYSEGIQGDHKVQKK